MVYFYVPPFVENGLTSLGEDDGGGVIYSEPGPSYQALTLDDSVPRFVLQTPPDTAGRPGWEIKTEGEVEADYPGLIGGA
jgi:hypothetical protein